MKYALLLFVTTSAVVAQDPQTVSDGVPALAKAMAAGIEREHKPKVAVLPFVELHGPRTALGTYVAEALTTQLVTEGVDVVERAVVERVMARLGISSSAEIGADAARAIGAETRVEAIIVGTITDMQSVIAVNGRVRDAASGRIISASEVLLARDGSVKGMLAQLLQPDGGSAAPSRDGPEPRNLTWTDGAARITIELQDRKRNSIELTLLFVNTTPKPLQLTPRRYVLTDENGDEYGFGYDTKQFVAKGVTIAPGKSARSPFVFVCRTGECSGTTFTVKDDAGAVVVKNLKIDP